MDGLDLLRFLIESTGLPPESLRLELDKLIAQHGIEPGSLTVDQIRDVLGEYLQDALIEAKEAAR